MVKSYIAYPYSALVITPLIEIYTPIVKTPIVGLMTIPKITCFDHGTYINESNCESDCDIYIYIISKMNWMYTGCKYIIS